MPIQSVGMIDPVKQWCDSDGIPLAGGTVTFYASGTLNLQDVYSDAGLTVPLTNPVALNAAGRTSTSSTGAATGVYLQQKPYDYVVKDSTGVTIVPATTVSGSQWPGSIQSLATQTPAANANAFANRLSTTIQKASSGTHALFTGTRFDIPTIGAGASTLTEASTVYIEGAPATGTNKYALHVAAGVASFDGGISSNGMPITFPAVDGQLLIGNTATGGPSTNTLTQSQGITITNGHGTITIAGTVLDKSTTEQNVVNTIAVTSIYSKSIVGGTLGTTGILRLTVTGEYSNTSGGNSTFAITGVYGGTTFCSGALQNFATATTGAFEMVITINANGATNSQRSVGRVNMVTSGTGTSVSWTQAGLVNVSFDAALAEDSTLAKTLSVSVTHGTADPNIFFKAWTRLLEVL